MNELVRSTIGVLALLGILVLTVVNTCQLDNTERRLDSIEQKIATGGPGPGSQPPTPQSCTEAVPPMPLEEADPLARAPGNRLVPAVRAWANAPHVECGTLRFETGVDPPGLNRIASKNAADMREIYLYVGNQLARRHPEDPTI